MGRKLYDYCVMVDPLMTIIRAGDGHVHMLTRKLGVNANVLRRLVRFARIKMKLPIQFDRQLEMYISGERPIKNVSEKKDSPTQPEQLENKWISIPIVDTRTGMSGRLIKFKE